MDIKAIRRLAFTIAAAITFAALATKPIYACENCPPGPNTEGKPANALPTYAQPVEEKVAAPVALKKFTKPQTRTARRGQPRKANLAQRARAGKYASHKAKPADEDQAAVDASVHATAALKAIPSLANLLANANAELVEPETAKATTAETTEKAQTPATDASSAQPPAIELVTAEEFNDLDRAAWEANQMPKLMTLVASDSRAEMRDDDSKWAQTSTIGKLFVAFGALLTFGSAIRMFMA